FEEAVPVALQIARGVGHAHAHGIVHRDIKPSNVMLLRDGIVKILDFGIATTEDLSPAGLDGRVGTLAYMSPEQLRGDPVDHRSDIWSLGVALHETLTGVRPCTGSDASALADAILNRDPCLIATSHPDVPSGIETVLRRALAKLPENRYLSITALAADLISIAGSGESSPAADHVRSGSFAQSSDSSGITERRRAAVLVTIVSNYGTLLERVAPSGAQRLVSHVRDLAVDVVRRHRGVVNQAIAEEIVSVFGVPAAHDDDE